MDVPLPPFEFQTLVCGPGGESHFESEGRRLVDVLRAHGMLEESIALLDVGCGCGRIARYLVDVPIGRYEGFDRHAGMIAWCHEMLAPRDPRLHFRYVSVRSIYVAWDQQAGDVAADTFVFPYADRSFDSILLASVFTHMPLREIAHYVRELARVLRPTGKILLSVFYSEGLAFLKDEINFFHEPEQFLGTLTDAGLTANPLEPNRLYDYNHNWYILTHA